MSYLIYRTYRWDNIFPCLPNSPIPDPGKLGKGFMTFDNLLPLTILVVGILGAVSVIPMGSTASYALISAGATGMFFSLTITAFFTKSDNVTPVDRVGNAPFFGDRLVHCCRFPL